MSALEQTIETDRDTASAVRAAATALDLNRARLAESLDTGAQASPVSGFRKGAVSMLMRGLATKDLSATLKPFAKRHPFGMIAIGAAAGGLAYVALPRLAVGLVVPVLWSEGRRLAGELLRGWLRSGPLRGGLP